MFLGHFLQKNKPSLRKGLINTIHSFRIYWNITKKAGSWYLGLAAFSEVKNSLWPPPLYILNGFFLILVSCCSGPNILNLLKSCRTHHFYQIKIIYLNIKIKLIINFLKEIIILYKNVDTTKSKVWSWKMPPTVYLGFRQPLPLGCFWCLLLILPIVV